MSIIGWIMTVSGAAVGTALFEIVFNWLFGIKRTKLKKSQECQEGNNRTYQTPQQDIRGK